MPSWQLWKYRLEEVGRNVEDGSIAEQGRKCYNIMSLGGRTQEEKHSVDRQLGPFIAEKEI